MMRISVALTVLLLGLALLTGAQASDDAAYSEQSDQARTLLHKAITRYRENGDTVLAQISRQGEFTDGEQYVYVIDSHGVMLASGGLSAIYIGRNVLPLLDEERKPLLEQILREPDNGQMRSEEYRWMNPNDGKVERKRAWYQRVGDKIFAVGYYLPRSSSQAAKALLDDALKALQNDPAATLKGINQLDKAFNRDDLYVFVVDTNTRKMVAHGYNPRLIDTDFLRLQAIDGQPIGHQMLKAIEGKTTALVSYKWRNPATGKAEPKNTLIQRSGHYLVAVGYYAQPKETAR
ncbi:MAG TPA: cache domain-containing protein [Pseudomonas sp.]|jgi:cytochrome c